MSSVHEQKIDLFWDKLDEVNQAVDSVLAPLKDAQALFPKVFQDADYDFLDVLVELIVLCNKYEMETSALIEYYPKYFAEE